MSTEKKMISKLNESLNPVYLEVIDESYKHVGHAGWKEEGETHFNVYIVSEEFTGKSKVARHKVIYSILKEELETGVHALSIKAISPNECSS